MTKYEENSTLKNTTHVGNNVQSCTFEVGTNESTVFELPRTRGLGIEISNVGDLVTADLVLMVSNDNVNWFLARDNEGGLVKISVDSTHTNSTYAFPGISWIHLTYRYFKLWSVGAGTETDENQTSLINFIAFGAS